MSNLLVTLPLQLACSLINPANPDYENVTFVQDTAAVTMSQLNVLPTDYTAFPDIGLAYKYYMNKLTWNVARKLCITEGGNLVVIDSFKKLGYVMSIKDKSTSVHTGIHRLFNKVEWISVRSGQALGFIPWKSDAILTAGTGQCVAMWYDGAGVTPHDCSKLLPAVCEIPIFKNHRNKTQICHEKNATESSTTEVQIDRRSQTEFINN